MQRRILVAAIALALALSAMYEKAAAMPLSVGQSIVINLNQFTLKDAPGFPDQGGVSVFLSGDLLNVGDVLRLELFEDIVESGLIYRNDFDVPTDSFGVAVIIPLPWQDLQGVVRLTEVQGSANIDHVIGQVFRGGDRFQETVGLAAVPTPSTFALFAPALGLLGLLRRRATGPNQLSTSGAAS